MQKKSKTVVFFGNERLATGVTTTAPTLNGLIKAGYYIAAVVVNQDENQSRNKRQLEIEIVASENNIPVIYVDKMTTISDTLKSFHADIGVLAAFGRIVPQSIIDIFPTGIINIHPSLLPRGRGTTPIESVILSGEKQTGVSIMRLVQEMDAGPVFAQLSLELTGHETKQQLNDSLLAMGSSLLVNCLPTILNGNSQPLPQLEVAATFTSLIKKEDGFLNWHKTAAELEREIRAYAIWPQSRTTLNSLDIIITKAHVEHGNLPEGEIQTPTKQKLLIGTRNNLLAIDKLKPLNRSEMTTAAFIAGYGQALGGGV